MKTIRYWSQSTISGGCCKKIDFVQQGWRLATDSNDSVFGTALHKFTALREQGVERYEAEVEAVKLMNNTPSYQRIGFLNAAQFSKVCDAWENRHRVGDETLVNPDIGPCVEFSLAWPIMESEEFIDIGTGTIDRLMYLHGNREIVAIEDNKHTCKKTPDLSEFEMSHQFLHYPWLIREYALNKPGSWITTEIFSKLKVIVIQSIQSGYKTPPIVERHEFQIDWERVDYYGEMLKKFIKNFDPNLKNGLLIGACMSGKDYACDMLHICKTGRTENYVNKPYDPIKRHENSKIATGSHVKEHPSGV